MVITVEGLECRHDVRALSTALADVDGVVALQIDVTTSTVTIDGSASPAAVREAIAAAGYSVT